MNMAPTRSDAPLLAPSADAPEVPRLPPAAERLPPVDERIVHPGSRAEIIEGRLYLCPPADEQHGSTHFDLAYVLRAHVAPGYLGALSMLTRTSEISDFAPKASIYPSERDPVTGGRKLEEIAFEIASEPSLGLPTLKARELARRGVRRVFCLLVDTRRVAEWSMAADAFVPVPEDAVIEDRTLVRPLPVAALFDADARATAVAEALKTRRRLELESLRQEGLLEGLRDALLLVLEARGLDVDTMLRECIAACKDPAALERWMDRAATARTCAEVFADE